MFKMPQLTATFLAAITLLTTAPVLSDESLAPSAHYVTAFTAYPGSSSVPYTGSLDLQATSAGIVHGYYNPEDVRTFVPVTGGRDGDRIWLDISMQGGWHIVGTVKGGKIVGQAWRDGDPQPFTFEATPKN